MNTKIILCVAMVLIGISDGQLFINPNEDFFNEMRARHRAQQEMFLAQMRAQQEMDAWINGSPSESNNYGSMNPNVQMPIPYSRAGFGAQQYEYAGNRQAQPYGVFSVRSMENAGPQSGEQFGIMEPSQSFPNVESRFSEGSSPGGNSYGTFTRTRYSSELGPDGNYITRRIVTQGTNDNGEMSVKTYEYPY